MTGTQFDSVILWLTANAISIFIGLVILVVGWILAGFVRRTLRNMLDDNARMDRTIAPLLADVARYAILALAIMMALGQMGVQTTSILAVLGAAGLAIALALQGTLSNIAAGVMLIWLRPIAIGEYIDAEGTAGTVVEIGLFATRLKSADGVYVFAPNSVIWNKRISNYSRERTRRLDLKVGISYSDDMSKARDILMKIASDERVLADPEAVVYVSNLGDSSVEMMLRVWVASSDYWAVLFDFTERTKRDFDANGISIPFNQLDVNLPADKPAAVAAKPAKAAAPVRASRAKPAGKAKAG